MSKSSKNKKLLKEMQEPVEKIDTSIEEKSSNRITLRTFKCPDCGSSVTLEGTVASDRSITKCSKCSSK